MGRPTRYSSRHRGPVVLVGALDRSVGDRRTTVGQLVFEALVISLTVVVRQVGSADYSHPNTIFFYIINSVIWSY